MSALSIQIRPAVPQDEDVICELSSEIDRYHLMNLPEIFQPTTGAIRECDYLEELMQNPDTSFLIAEVIVSGMCSIAGYIVAYVREPRLVPVLRPERLVLIDTLVVGNEYRRQGVGKALLEATHAWSKQKGVSAIELNVYEFNQSAIHFYEEMGYKTLRRTMRYPL